MPSRPQFARTCYEDFIRGQEEKPSVPSSAIPQVKRASRGRGGRKIGKVEEAKRRERERGIRKGELSKDYALSFVRRNKIEDPMRTLKMVESEGALWDELNALHLQIAQSKPSHREANDAYNLELEKRMQRLEHDTAHLLVDNQKPLGGRVTELHASRRLLAIHQQEQELLSKAEPEARTIGEDGAFIALGRGIKMHAFRKSFGWWSAEELVCKYDLIFDTVDLAPATKAPRKSLYDNTPMNSQAPQ